MTVVHSFAKAVSLASMVICLAGATGCVGGDAPDDAFDSGGKAGSGSGGTGGKGGTGGSGAKAGSGGSTPAAGSGGSMSLKAGAKGSHFPLVDGATWTYHHAYPQNPSKMAWDEIATMRATTYMDKPAFVLEDEEDAQGEHSSSTMLVDGTRVLRVFKEVKVADKVAFNTSYVPGFLRYDEAWADSDGQADEMGYDSEQNCVTMSSASKCAPGAVKKETTKHSFKVLNQHAEVTVAAGKFETVQIERINVGDPSITSDDETKHFWYAAGVGKVRELDVQNGATEELSAFDIP